MDTTNSTLFFDYEFNKNTEKINIAESISMIVNDFPTSDKKVILKEVDKELLAEADKINAHFKKIRKSIKESSPYIDNNKNNFISITAETLVDKHLIPQIKKELGVDFNSYKKKRQVVRDISLPRINTVNVKNSSKKKEIKKESDFKLVSITKK
uniref:Aldolase_II domain-containing protein n=1 Tax=Strongyloides stercoralis TaxID=6248 RepID=A0A0K0EKC0_STRER